MTPFYERYDVTRVIEFFVFVFEFFHCIERSFVETDTKSTLCSIDDPNMIKLTVKLLFLFDCFVATLPFIFLQHHHFCFFRLVCGHSRFVHLKIADRSFPYPKPLRQDGSLA